MLWFAGFGAVLHAAGWLTGTLWKRKHLPWLAWALILVVGGLAGAAACGLAGLLPAGPAASPHAPLYVLCALPALLGVLVLGNFLSVAVGSCEGLKRPFYDEDREWWARAAGWLLIVAVVWLAFSGLVLFGPRALRALDREIGEAVTKWYLSVGGTLSGALSALIGWSSKTTWFSKKGDGKLAGILGGLAEKLLAPLFAVWLLATLARGTAFLAEGRPWWQLAAATALLLGLGWMLGYFLSVNRFALHNMYRNRLIRAYLGASRGGERQPDPFTGFDPQDNLLMTRLQAVQRPFQVLNLTLNITTGEELAWQQRKAQSFTVSSRFAGFGGPGDPAGYQPSDRYTDQGGISLGTAMTVSGAAASPNMGYHSSHVLAFLMALFNARLGAWLPNSRSDKDNIVQAGGPRSPFFLWREAFGMASAKARWVYLSDGGHFDNLGLYEMVRRHAKLIVVSDAAADPGYALGDLSRAIQNIRADLGVPIEFVKTPVLRPKSQGLSHHCALLKIRYSAAHEKEPDGLLLYIKPAISGREALRSRDVDTYSAAHKDFPQESTGDQFFSEAQFESYRRLGEQSVEEITDGWKGSTLAELFKYVEEAYLAGPPQAPTAHP